MIASEGVGQFSSGVSLVEVYATVVDSQGAPVTNLPSDAFIVEEDGVRQQIDLFTAGEFPLALAVGIDRSFSMRADRLAQVTAAVQHLLGALRPADRVMLLAIGSEVETIAPLSIDRRAAVDALRDLRPWGTTPLFDATVRAIDAVQGASGRRALVLITDGDDRYSTLTAVETVSYTRGRDVLVYPVVLRGTPPPVFAELADVTGGRSSGVADLRTLPTTLSSIAGELRQQYLIGYTSRVSAAFRPGWRSLSVRVTRPGLRVRARDGYAAR